MPLPKGNIEKLEKGYRELLQLVSEPEKNKEGLAELLKSDGYNVTPEDFIGARLGTGPEDRPYLKEKYGVISYPSTIYIPKEKWENELSVHLNTTGYGGVALRLKQVNVPFMFKCMLERKEKDFHEDFHELFEIYRLEEFSTELISIDLIILNELHSHHITVDNLEADWNYFFTFFNELKRGEWSYEYFSKSGLTIKELYPIICKLEVLCKNLEKIHRGYLPKLILPIKKKERVAHTNPNKTVSYHTVIRLINQPIATQHPINHSTCKQLESFLLSYKTIAGLNRRLEKIIKQR